VIVTERVRAASRSYDVAIGAGIRHGAADRLRGLGADRIMLVSDENVAPLYAPDVERSFEKAGLRTWTHVLPAGESGKTRDTLAALHDDLATRSADRDVVLIALGGGVVGDVTGFAAATWMRGVRFGILPTSLLAMADASVGGKTAVNLPAGKNLVGAFHQPSFVLVDVVTLETLPEEEFRSGLGEAVKMGVLGDDELFRRLEDETGAVLAREPWITSEIVRRCVRLKADIVERDERETGERRLLNLGHTLGHAIEAAAGYGALRHGEAVAIGTVFAARLAVWRGLLPGRDAERIERLVLGLGLPTEIPDGLDAETLAAFVARDKKQRGAEPRWVLPTAIGAATVQSVDGWACRIRP
jgi:3-dehydroquinate synthase